MTGKKPTRSSQEEPSVLDWFKAIFSGNPAPEIPELPPDSSPSIVKSSPKTGIGGGGDAAIFLMQFPWRILAALFIALTAQFSLQSSADTLSMGILLYLIALSLTIWSALRGDLSLTVPPEKSSQKDDLTIRFTPLAVGLAVSLLAFWAFSGNKFTAVNVFLWIVGLGCVLWAIWLKNPGASSWIPRLKSFIKKGEWHPKITWRTILFIAALGIGVFFQVHKLGSAIPEMTSDHKEKLMDVYEISQGETLIFFPRNTGREGLQMYLISTVNNLFETGLSFLSMKIGNAFLMLFMLVYMYFLGKEIGSRWTGLLAMFLIGIAYWPNVLARDGLRHILYAVFTAPTLYHLLRGIRTEKRNHFILSGIFLGIGLHGYSPFRAVPILVVVAVGIYLLHERSKEIRQKVFIWLGLLILVSMIIFLPLLRYWQENPEAFNQRLLTRTTNIETEIPGPPLLVFLGNVWIGLKMMNVYSGNTWVITIPNFPSLGVVSGSMFLLGAGMLVVRYIRQRYWRDLFLLLAIPILMLPSTIVIAFPKENPAPNRASGTMVVVFLIAALALEALLRGIKEKAGPKYGIRAASYIGIFVLFFAAVQNYGLLFNKYSAQYIQNSWNYSELGAVIDNFIDTVGHPDQAWVVPFPHWVDTSLVAISAGYPGKDIALWPDQIATTLEIPGPKIFLFKIDDIEAMTALQEVYPDGALSPYHSKYIPDVENISKDFFIFFVPASEDISLETE